ncbi:MAG: TlpA family protein disulfide reductase [Anaerolineales bacterium]|nr:TlpA family protein disulfide reductase [Anaerolineales bacterium]
MTRPRIIAAVGAMAFALAAVWLLWQAGLPTHPTAVDTLQPFRALTIEGEPLSIEAGRPVILNFWATWCLPCITEMPLLQQAYAEHEVMLVGINAGEEEATVQAWIEDRDIQFPIVIDAYGELQAVYRVRGLPTTIFIDQDGYVYRVVEGAISRETLERNIKEIE